MIRRELKKKTGGFTLLEMLVVLLISSIVLLVLGVMAKSTFEIMRTGESRSQLNNSAQLTLDYLGRDIETATSIPPMNDRNLTGIPDDDVREHDQAARWILGYEVGTSFYMPTNYAMSEAFSDHVKLSHSSEYRIGFDASIISEALSPPKDLKIQGMRVVNFDSYYKVAIPTVDAPYYMSTISYNRTYIPAERYPQSVALGFRDETAVLTQDLDIRYRPYEAAGESNVGIEYERSSAEMGDYVYRFHNQPIGTNITRLRLEYFMEVPVYKVDAAGDVAYRNLATGEVVLESAPTVDSGGTSGGVSDSIPIIDHYELRWYRATSATRLRTARGISTSSGMTRRPIRTIRRATTTPGRQTESSGRSDTTRSTSPGRITLILRDGMPATPMVFPTGTAFPTTRCHPTGFRTSALSAQRLWQRPRGLSRTAAICPVR